MVDPAQREWAKGCVVDTFCQQANNPTASLIADLDHAVIVSGYGEQDGSAYWIVKNTWSSHWGEVCVNPLLMSYRDCCLSPERVWTDNGHLASAEWLRENCEATCGLWDCNRASVRPIRRRQMNRA